ASPGRIRAVTLSSGGLAEVTQVHPVDGDATIGRASRCRAGGSNPPSHPRPPRRTALEREAGDLLTSHVVWAGVLLCMIAAARP
ncbi:hypothetical protein CTI14_52755, partial [Methylobacterium radiotolerans]